MATYMANGMTGAPTLYPFPDEDWIFNKFSLDAMRIIFYFGKMLEKDSHTWTPEEDKFYVDIYKETPVNVDSK